MAYRVYLTLIASVSAAALMLATHETVARSGVAAGGFSAARPIPNASAVPWFRHRHRHFSGNYWLGSGGYYDDAPNGERFADADVTSSTSREIRYVRDVPWDWAHRYPPDVAPSDRPYVSSCTSEPVTVPGWNGEETTINITRCY
jgi:hypothetical protein